MERKYKAFISYRHLPLDMQVAKKLHRRIEQFIIPRDLRVNGEKKLGLVFRDQDELPLSSDLSANIREALDNAEFLIVICTPETRKSAWVMREISYFLEHHDRDHVLAVLAEGKPSESFPPQLMGAGQKKPAIEENTDGQEDVAGQESVASRENVAGQEDVAGQESTAAPVFAAAPLLVPGMEMQDDDPAKMPGDASGSGNSNAAEITPIPETISWEEEGLKEPLAADIVADTAAKRNRLFRTESLRILAALIGCSFDDLYRREQRYRMRRFAIAGGVLAAVAAAFIIVLLGSNARIQANYEEALRNQSVYLASESMKLLEAGDRLGAMRLAMYALPSKEQDRPLVSRAELALEQAVGAYVSPANASGITATGALTHENKVTSFLQNDSATMLVSQTSADVITGWNTQTMQKCWEVPLKTGSSLNDLHLEGFLDDATVIAWTDEMICCISAENGEIIWSVNSKDIPSELEDSYYSGWISRYLYAVVLVPDKKELVAITSDVMFRLDPFTGEVLAELPLPSLEDAVNLAQAKSEDGDGGIQLQKEESEEDVEYYFQLTTLRPSEDGRQVAVQYERRVFTNREEYEYEDEEGIAVVDLEDGSIRAAYGGIPENFYFPGKYVFPDADHVVFITSDLSKGSSSTFWNFTTQVYSDNQLSCLDLTTGQLSWTSTHRSSITGGNDLFCKMDGSLGNTMIAYAYANHVDLIDSLSGELIAGTEFNSRIVSLGQMKDFFYCIMQDGSLGYVDPADLPQWNSSKYFTDNITAGQCRPGDFWVLSSNDPLSLVHFCRSSSDPGWVELETQWNSDEDRDNFYTDDAFTVKGCLAFLDDNILLLSDGKTDSPILQITLPNEDGYPGTQYYPGHCYDGIFSMFWSDSQGAGVVHIDMNAMEYEIIPFPEGEEKVLSAFVKEGENTYYLVTGTQEGDHRRLQVWLADPDFTVQKKIDVGQIDADTSTISLSDESKHIYICAQDENTVFCVDLKKGKTTTCPDALTDLLLGITRASNTPGELIHFSPDGSMLAAQKEDDVLEIMSTDGSIHYTIEEETTSFLSASFTPDGKTLLTVDLSGYLRRYRARDGQLLGRTDLYYSSLYNSTKIEWQFTERGFFTVKVDSVLNMIRYQDWEVFTYLTSSMGYLEEEDFFVCSIYAGDGENYSGFKRYSPQLLMDYAEELLNGWDLNDTQKTKYGLTD